MGFFKKILLALFVLGVAISYQAYRDLSKPFDRPEIDLNEYWGKGSAKAYKEDKTIKPFKISYSPEIIKRLKDKLDDAKISEPLEDTYFEYGFHADHLKKLLSYWKGEYLQKWNEREEYLNQFPQFSTNIQGLNIHYIHVKPKTKPNTKVYPVILLHGWPGSVREFYDIIPLLTSPSEDNIAFEVIAPSLPGYGWSEGSSKKGLGPLKISVIFRNLMLRLGYKKFYIQGGDWGSIIGSNLATMFPENTLGYHSNMCSVMSPMANIKTFIASFYPSLFIDDEKLIQWIYPFGPKFFELLQESGYMHIQATKPETIGTALINNPVGLAAYIIEKFSTWTNKEYRQLPDGGLDKYFTLDSLLDNVMVYYLTDSITTSVRIYKESFIEDAVFEMGRVPLIKPAGCAYYKHEILHQPRFILEDKFTNLIHTSIFDDGGHFLSMQLPKTMHKDFVEFVRKTLIPKKPVS